ncbi:hypothetical protein OE88DRAFT_1610905, partial [Heliocybe sulcata]
LFRTPNTVVLRNNDVCSSGDWVIWLDYIPPQVDRTEPSAYWRVGLVQEILQICGSSAERRGKGDFILLKRAIVGDVAAGYQMPRVAVMDEYVLVEAAHCTVNVQHNCVKNRCKVARCQPVYQERELTAQLSNVVQHVQPLDCILNTTQMRDASRMDPFRIPVPELNRSDIIHAAALEEVQAAK